MAFDNSVVQLTLVVHRMSSVVLLDELDIASGEASLERELSSGIASGSGDSAIKVNLEVIEPHLISLTGLDVMALPSDRRDLLSSPSGGVVELLSVKLLH